MSTRLGVFTDLYHDPARHTAPLPAREGAYGSGPAAGHVVCAIDWAALAEMLAERTLWSDTISVFPHCMVFGGRAFNHAAVIRGNLLQGVVGQYLDGNVVAGAGLWRHADHALAPVSPRIDGPIPYSVSDQLNRVKLRRVDDVRRMFYDVKRMSRLCANCQITYTGVLQYSWCGINGTTGHVDKSPITRAQVGPIANISQTVQSDARYSATPYKAVINFEGWRTADSVTYNRIYKHLPVTFGADVDLTGWEPDDLVLWLRDEFGALAAGYTYEARAYVECVYFDMKLPLDFFLTPWTWTPQI